MPADERISAGSYECIEFQLFISNSTPLARPREMSALLFRRHFPLGGGLACGWQSSLFRMPCSFLLLLLLLRCLICYHSVYRLFSCCFCDSQCSLLSIRMSLFISLFSLSISAGIIIYFFVNFFFFLFLLTSFILPLICILRFLLCLGLITTLQGPLMFKVFCIRFM